MEEQQGDSIRVVSHRSGLPYVIRAWERRSRAVGPERDTKRRPYNGDTEIARLRLVRFPRGICQAGVISLSGLAQLLDLLTFPLISS
ncbi:MAG: hypothetical protein VX733_08150 [Candidatus Latescibacterota bacterium]|nr:hypothetical protein [Candidatus Latescibacterota bacterium]